MQAYAIQCQFCKSWFFVNRNDYDDFFLIENGIDHLVCPFCRGDKLDFKEGLATITK